MALDDPLSVGELVMAEAIVELVMLRPTEEGGAGLAGLRGSTGGDQPACRKGSATNVGQSIHAHYYAEMRVGGGSGASAWSGAVRFPILRALASDRDV